MSEREDFLAQVASMYYEENLTQVEIARQIGGSRSTVSRLLNEARQSGIVEITIHRAWRRETDLEHRLKGVFDVYDTAVVKTESRSAEETLKGLGEVAARFVDSNLREGSILGISWGTAVHSTVQALKPEKQIPINVVQMIGAVGLGDPMIDGPDLARFLANKYGGEYHYLHAPLVVESEEVQLAFHQESRIQSTLTLARKSEVALVGIGTVHPQESSLKRAGYLDETDLDELRFQGAVGDICARYYDALGRNSDIELNRRIVGIELEELRKIERVIAVAGGEVKAEAILGALRGGYVDVLVTDDKAAERIIDLVSNEES